MSLEPELEPPSSSDGWEVVGPPESPLPEEAHLDSAGLASAAAAAETPETGGPGDAAGPVEEPASEREDEAGVPAAEAESRPRVSREHTFDDELLAKLAAQLRLPIQGVEPVERILRAYTAGVSFQPLFFDDTQVPRYWPVGDRPRCWTAVGFEQFGWTRFRPKALTWRDLGLVIIPWASQAEAEAYAYGLRAETHHRLAFRLAEDSLRNVFI